MIEHVNDIIQRIDFTLGLNKPPVRPSSAIKKPKKSTKDTLSKANIHFEDFTARDSTVQSITNSEISDSLQDCL